MRKLKIVLYVTLLIFVLVIFLSRFSLILPNNPADLENTFYWLELIILIGITSFFVKNIKPLLYSALLLMGFSVLLYLIGLINVSEIMMRFTFVIWLVGIIGLLVKTLKKNGK